MTEQEQIEAVNALTAILSWKLHGKNWSDCSPQGQESLRHSTAHALKALHVGNHLNAKDVYEFLVMGRWEEATEQDKLICANAAQAMREVLEQERKEQVERRADAETRKWVEQQEEGDPG